VLEFLPFNQDLNRYMLIVNGASTPKVKVTWGKTSKEFAAADLAKGINLADEFLDNPFCAPFQAVEAKIREQQAAETEMIKIAVHALPAFLKQVPDRKDVLEQLRTDMITKDKSLQDASTAAVTPVTHTILIEPVK